MRNGSSDFSWSSFELVSTRRSHQRRHAWRPHPSVFTILGYSCLCNNRYCSWIRHRLIIPMLYRWSRRSSHLRIPLRCWWGFPMTHVLRSSSSSTTISPTALTRISPCKQIVGGSWPRLISESTNRTDPIGVDLS